MTDSAPSIEAVLRDRVAAAHDRRTAELRTQVEAAERRLAERLAVTVTFRLVLEGPGGGAWHLVLRDGAMHVERATDATPLITVFQNVDGWERLLAAGGHLFTAAGGPEFSPGRVARLEAIAGALEFRLLEVDAGDPVSVIVQLGGGRERLDATTTITLRAADAQRLRSGDLTPPQAMMQGLVQIGGDASLAIQVGIALFM